MATKASIVGLVRVALATILWSQGTFSFAGNGAPSSNGIVFPTTCDLCAASVECDGANRGRMPDQGNSAVGVALRSCFEQEVVIDLATDKLLWLPTTTTMQQLQLQLPPRPPKQRKNSKASCNTCSRPNQKMEMNAMWVAFPLHLD